MQQISAGTANWFTVACNTRGQTRTSRTGALHGHDRVIVRCCRITPAQGRKAMPAIPRREWAGAGRLPSPLPPPVSTASTSREGLSCASPGGPTPRSRTTGQNGTSGWPGSSGPSAAASGPWPLRKRTAGSRAPPDHGRARRQPLGRHHDRPAGKGHRLSRSGHLNMGRQLRQS